MSRLSTNCILDIADVPDIRVHLDGDPMLSLGRDVLVWLTRSDTPAQQRDTADAVLAAVTAWRDAIHRRGDAGPAPEQTPAGGVTP